MSIFTKLSVNGEVRDVASFYDGSGNNIAETYETISNVSTKESALNDKITTVSEALEALTKRVETTEAFDTRITKNAEDIKTNADAIGLLQEVDNGYRTELDSLTIKVGELTTSVGNANSSLGTLSLSMMTNSTKIGALEAAINDEAQGLAALNTQADQNTADIATKVSQESFNALAARVQALEEALAANHPSNGEEA